MKRVKTMKKQILVTVAISAAMMLMVARLKPNELGLYDMSGNVCEWCEDIYGDYPSEPQVNPQGVSEGAYHPGRGGGWNRGGKFCLV